MNNFCVSIDIGHTLKNPGAISYSKIPEYMFNRNIAYKLKSELNDFGIDSFIVDESGSDISLEDRPERALSGGASIFISLHHDSVQPQDLPDAINISGYSLFVSKLSPPSSVRLAVAIGPEMLSYGFSPNTYHSRDIEGENKPYINKMLGIYEYDHLIVLEHSKIPAVLIECGVLVNPIEELFMLDRVTQKKIVLALVHGIIAYK